ncbi:hypothetical protein DPM17_03705 [Polynucleobacter paneuropaeus]|uniref:HIRAN domain-containing protein n=1 Tax=Polynucleobacter paneuropaeus TaxID=2527775 RepID=UPI000DBF1F9A|nr:HIRAN domain-containing protein [Polynucleobacter paneuropaeus]AWW47835.1 hypothetical protein DPM17_03705 [Polynucleobacter paneuropaeus]
MWIFSFIIAIYILYRLLNKDTKSNPIQTPNPINSQSSKRADPPIPIDEKTYTRQPIAIPSLNEFTSNNISSYIAGIPHRLGKNIKIASILSVGQNLNYLREPRNQHDKNAIKLMVNGMHVGYIPKDDNPKIARHLDSGKPISVTVTSIDPSDLWRGVHIKIVFN